MKHLLRGKFIDIVTVSIVIMIFWNVTPCSFVGKVISVIGCGGPYGCEASRLPHFLDSRLTDGGNFVSLTRQPLFATRKIPGTHFLYKISEESATSICGVEENHFCKLKTQQHVPPKLGHEFFRTVCCHVHKIVILTFATVRSLNLILGDMYYRINMAGLRIATALLGTEYGMNDRIS
jgi:hypothetical protein